MNDEKIIEEPFDKPLSEMSPQEQFELISAAKRELEGGARQLRRKQAALERLWEVYSSTLPSDDPRLDEIAKLIKQARKMQREVEREAANFGKMFLENQSHAADKP